MSSRFLHALLYSALIVLNVMLVELVNQFHSGNIPIPPQYQWVASVVAAGLMALSMLLPRMTDSENTSHDTPDTNGRDH